MSSSTLSESTIPPILPQTEVSKKSSSRCSYESCRAKLPLTAFACHCQKKFCTLHRYPEDHACSHDFKKDHRDTLLKTMSTSIVAEKITRI